MRILPHPLLERDIVGMAEHIFSVSGDGAAARRRVLEISDLIQAIAAERGLGAPLDGKLAKWCVRHRGQGRRNTDVDAVYVALVTFGGQKGGRTPLSDRGSANATHSVSSRSTARSLQVLRAEYPPSTSG